MFFTRGANALSTSFRTSARQFEEGEFDESPLLLLDTASNINLVQRQNSLAPGTIYSKETVIEGVKEGEMLVAQVAGTLPIRTTNGVHLSLGETVQADGASANIISLQRLADRGAIITLNSTGGSIKLPGAPNLLPVGREQGFWTLKHVPAPGQGKVRYLATQVAPSPQPSSPHSPSRLPSSPTHWILAARRKPSYGRWHRRLCHPGLDRFRDRKSVV